MALPTDPSASFVTAYASTMADLAAATTGRTRRTPGGTVLAVSGAPVAALNAVISPTRPADVDEVVALASQEAPRDLPWSIQVRGVPDPVLVAAAARLGLTRAERQPLMVRRADAGSPDAPAVDGLRVRAVAADELALYARTVAAEHDALPVLSTALLWFVLPMTALLLVLLTVQEVRVRRRDAGPGGG